MSTVLTVGTSDAVARIETASRRSTALGAAPEGTISLAMGEPEGGTPQSITAAAISALEDGLTRYAPMSGLPELRRELARFTRRTTERTTTAAEVVLAHGGSGGLAASILALVNPGDRVLIPDPSYSLYADQVALAGGQVVWIEHSEDGRLDLAAIVREAATAKMLLLCNPGNPSGLVYDRDQIEALAGILQENPHLVLLADEAYGDLVFDERGFTSALSLPQVRSQVVGCFTFSKRFAMTGWRLGYVVAPEELAVRIELVHRTINGPLNTFVQHAALEALRQDDGQLAALVARYQQRRDMVVQAIDGLPGVHLPVPQGAFYAFPKIDSSLSSTQLAAHASSHGVLVRAGSEFGPSGEGHIRLCFATDEHSLHEALSRLADALRCLPVHNPG